MFISLFGGKVYLNVNHIARVEFKPGGEAVIFTELNEKYSVQKPEDVCQLRREIVARLLPIQS